MAQYEPGTPPWWLDRLGKRLIDRSPLIRKYEAYYEGDHKLRFMTARFREAFGGMFQHFSDNWCELVVDAVAERLTVEGFRFGSDPAADGDAWHIWQENDLDSESKLLQTEAFKNGISYTMVQPSDDSTTARPVITAEHPLYMIHAHAPGNRRRTAAALKLWQNDWEHLEAFLLLPEGDYRWRSPKPVQRLDVQWRTLVGHLLRDDPEESINRFGGHVPVVPFVNRPSLLKPYGRSEIANVLGTQDAVNKLVVDMLVNSHFTAFRQKWATGLEIPKDPDTGLPREDFEAAVDRIWGVKAADAKFGEFSAGDISQAVSAIQTLVQHMASQTRTPPHYFYLRGEFPSGESLKAAETGLVAKAKHQGVHLGDSHEETIRLGFRLLGDPRADEVMAETIWADVESRTEAETVDAAMKRQAIGVPVQQLWEDVGYTPAQVARFGAMRAQDALLGLMGGGGPPEEEPTTSPAVPTPLAS